MHAFHKVLCLIFICGSVGSKKANYFTATKQGCDLAWTQFSAGNEWPLNLVDLKDNSDSTSDPLVGVLVMPIARKNLFGFSSIGATDEKCFGHFYNKRRFRAWTYEILTNPSKCNYQWVPNTDKDKSNFLFAVRHSNQESIGRCFVQRWKIWLPCTIRNGKCYYVDPKGDGGLEMAERFQRLISYSYLSMNLRYLNCTIIKDIYNIKMIGSDVIRNKADVELRKSIVHTTNTVTTYNWDFGFSFKIRAGLSLNIMKDWSMDLAPDLAGYFSFSLTNNYYQTRITEELLTVTRDIDVPARTSVEVTSILIMREVLLNISAEAMFSSEGQSSSQVLQSLKDAGISESGTLYLEGDSVVLSTNSSVHGIGPFQTEFIVKPINARSGSFTNLFNDRIVKENVDGHDQAELAKFIESYSN